MKNVLVSLQKCISFHSVVNENVLASMYKYINIHSVAFSVPVTPLELVCKANTA